MITTQRASKSRDRLRKNHRQQPSRIRTALEGLEARQMLSADFGWNGDMLQITGSDNNDFIAVQHDELGVKVFTKDAIYTEHEGRSFDDAASISVIGGNGNDVLFSYNSPVDVDLSGGADNDFLYSNNPSDVLDGGDGYDWVYSDAISGVWENAFGIPGLSLDPTHLTGTPTFDPDDRIGLQVEVGGELDVAGQPIDIAGLAQISLYGVDVAVTGSTSNWTNAFGITRLDLTDTSLTIGAGTDVHDGNGYRLDLTSNLDIQGTSVGIDGQINVTESEIDAAFTGTVADWDNAFGIEGFDLQNAELSGTGAVDSDDNYTLGFGISADMDIEGTIVDVMASVAVTQDDVYANFQGSVQNWPDAFGISGLTLDDVEVGGNGYSNSDGDYDLYVDLIADMDIDGTSVGITGSVDIEPERVAGSFSGSVAADWVNAFGIQGLTLYDTTLAVNAIHDTAVGESLFITLDAAMDISGTNTEVSGTFDLEPSSVSGSLTGTVGGEWADAFGVVGLNLRDTTIGVAATKSSEESEVLLAVSAEMDILSTPVAVTGTVEIDSEGASTSLTGTVAGNWTDAFGISGLELQDTSLTVSAESGGSGPGLNIDLDTSLLVFGDYIDVTGGLGIQPSGVNVSLAPPTSLDFPDLLGIPGLSFDDAGLVVTAGTDGLEVAMNAAMDMDNLDVDFVGVFAISETEIQASLTGSVDSWDNAFEIPGLNLDDVVMTLGVESSSLGSSMFIGLGAGIDIGEKSLDVAGLVGAGTTGWDIAFRGSTDSITSNDLIAFANAIIQGADPSAPAIPAGALGDFELKDPYINFAPKGGNTALGIADGFGIGGAFYQDGEFLAEGEFVVDLDQATFEVELDVPQLDLGPVELSDVLIDIRIATFDSHFRVAGTTELMGATVMLDGEVNGDGSFSLTGSGNVTIDGLDASAEFTVDNSGTTFEATVAGEAVDAIKGTVTHGLTEAATAAQTAIDQAQAAVDVARDEVDRLESELAAARATAQAEIDEVKDDLEAAKVIVDNAASSKNYWYGVRRSRYYSWRSAVAATNSAPWWQKPYYKSIEASRYASYAYAASVYSAKVGVYNAAVVAYDVIVDAAGWALDTAGVEANPEVIRLTVLKTAADVAVTTAEVALSAVEQANSVALAGLAIANSLTVDQITISGDVSNFVQAGVELAIDYQFAGNSYSLAMSASTDDLVNQIAAELLSIL